MRKVMILADIELDELKDPAVFEAI